MGKLTKAEVGKIIELTNYFTLVDQKIFNGAFDITYGAIIFLSAPTEETTTIQLTDGWKKILEGLVFPLNLKGKFRYSFELKCETALGTMLAKVGKNGDMDTGLTHEIACDDNYHTIAPDDTTLNNSSLWNFAQGDSIEIWIKQENATPLNAYIKNLTLKSSKEFTRTYYVKVQVAGIPTTAEFVEE